MKNKKSLEKRQKFFETDLDLNGYDNSFLDLLEENNPTEIIWEMVRFNISFARVLDINNLDNIDNCVDWETDYI